MKGLAPHTALIIEEVSKLDCIAGWTLVGGTALSLQLLHRQSEDLDFMKWQEDTQINFGVIRKELETVGEVTMEVIDRNQVSFTLEGVKLSFYIRQGKSPVVNTIPYLNHIELADIDSIAVMKMEVMLRRSRFRDYYDLYCIFREKKNIIELAHKAGVYSNHALKTKTILGILSNHHRFDMEKEFARLAPIYDVGGQEIEEYIKKILLEVKS